MPYNKKMLVVLSLVTAVTIAQCDKNDNGGGGDVLDPALVKEGTEIFRFDTFGDEDFWSGVLHIDKAIAGAGNGGFGGGVSPNAALAIGLKVDAAALPANVVAGIQSGAVKLDDPATTLTLLKLNAVVGVKGNFNTQGALKSIGITCASCHSTVDDSFAPGIGKRLDGWPNRDLNVGAIISLTDNAKPFKDMLHVDELPLRIELASWGPGEFPAILIMAAKASPPGRT